MAGLAERGLEKCVFCRRAACFQTPSLSHQSSQVILWQLFRFIHQALGNPSTSALEVTRWHQTCICKNASTLHRLYSSPLPPNPTQHLLSDGWPVTENLSHTNSDSAGTLLRPETRPWNDVYRVVLVQKQPIEWKVWRRWNKVTQCGELKVAFQAKSCIISRNTEVKFERKFNLYSAGHNIPQLVRRQEAFTRICSDLWFPDVSMNLLQLQLLIKLWCTYVCMHVCTS